MSDVSMQTGCQFGSHSEPFLWHGSNLDEVDIAIKQLINLSIDNPKLAKEAAEFVSACVQDAAQQSVQSDGAICPDCKEPFSNHHQAGGKYFCKPPRR